MNIGEVYFAQTESGPIKVGFSLNTARRIANIQTTIPEKLSLLATVRGTLRTELYFHDLLRSHKMTGEWYRPDPAVLLIVDGVRESGEGAVPDEYGVSDTDSARADVTEHGDFMRVCQDYCSAIAGPRRPRESVRAQMIRCATVTGLPFCTIRRIWYGDGAVHAFQYVRLKEIFEAREAVRMARRLGALDRAVAPEPEGE